MEPWQSWTLAIALGGAAVYYYKPKGNSVKGRAAARASAVPEQPSSSTYKRHKDKQSTQHAINDSGSNVSSPEPPPSTADVTSSKLNTPKQAKTRKQDKAPSSVPLAPPPLQNDEPDDVAQEVDEKEWVEQLEARKKGVSLSNRAAGPQRQSKRQEPRQNGNSLKPLESRNHLMKENEVSTTPHAPPSITANGLTAGHDVADMLEPAAAAPAIIRITGEAKAKKQQAPRDAPVQETKKQRQNRKKADEKKIALEQAEKERKVLEEKQRRSAREARGEPAKNGVPVSKASNGSVWSASNTNGTEVNGPAVRNGYVNGHDSQLLDTFDPDGVSTTSSNEATTNATSPATVASTLDQDLPSEETQMRMLHEMHGDSGWNEVAAKNKKGKKKTQTAVLEPGVKENKHSMSIPTSNFTNGSAEEPTFHSRKTAPSNGYAALGAGTGFTLTSKGHPDDSDWAVL